MNTILTRTHSLQVALLTGALLLGAGCNRQTATQPARTDQQISNDVQAKISAEGALNGQNIQVAVANGVATLSGNANDDASRALAGNDAGSVDGVKTVVNNLTVQPPQTAAAPAPAPVAPPPVSNREREREKKKLKKEERQVAENTPPPPPPVQAPAPVE